MTHKTDQELLDLMQRTTDAPPALEPAKPQTAYDMAQEEFELERAEYEEEMRMLAQPEDDQEAWRETMRRAGRL